MSNHHQDLSKKSIQSNCSQKEEEKLDNFKLIMKNNKEWAAKCVEEDPDYFTRLVNVQKPKYLWIGCSDSRVPANQIMGLKPGEVFVHRNVANIVSPSDINVLAVVQYAVEHLGVQDIIVSGHYNCGGIKAAFKQNDFGPLQSWLSHIRELRSKFRQSLLGNQQNKEHTLVQLNVKQQVVNVSRIPAVQQAWVRGHNLHIHGIVYNIKDGILKDLGLTTSRLQHVPEEYRVAKKQKPPKQPKKSNQLRQLKQLKQQQNYHNRQMRKLSRIEIQKQNRPTVKASYRESITEEKQNHSLKEVINKENIIHP